MLTSSKEADTSDAIGRRKGLETIEAGSAAAADTKACSVQRTRADGRDLSPEGCRNVIRIPAARPVILEIRTNRSD